jgi:hypothetical protein
MRSLRHLIGPTISALILAAGVVALGTGEPASAATATAGTSAATASGRSIAALALANLGMHACSTNSLGGTSFETSCTGNGGEPEYWCADFARWVWANSGVADTWALTAAAGSFYSYGLQFGTLTSTPAVGDAAVFDYYGGGVADHVAIVTQVNGNGTIETTSGDWGGDPGSEAHFASTSTVQLNSPAYTGTIGSYSAVMGMRLSGFVAPVGVKVWPVEPRARLGAGHTLSPGESITSPNGLYALALTTSGQLVETAAGRTIWSPMATGSPGDELIMQSDGDLAIYSASHALLWSSRTGGHTSGSYWLNLYDSGELAVNTSSGSLWTRQAGGAAVLAPGTVLAAGQALVSANGLYVTYMQSDGNLVEYTGGRVLWDSATGGNPGARAIMRANGRLVVVSSAGSVIWSSRTTGGAGTARAALLASGELVVRAKGTLIWSSGVSNY